MISYYIYVHKRLDTNEIFYVGRGKLYKNEISERYKKSKIPYRRAFAKDNRNKDWLEVIKQVKYDIIVLFDKLQFNDACNLETELIKFHGRRDLGLGPLTNKTDGGEDEINRVYKPTTKVRSYNNDGKLLKVFSSIKEASKYHNVDINIISKNCKNKINFSRKGIRFRYDSQNLDMIDISYCKANSKDKYKIAQYDVNLNLIKIYTSINDASQNNNTTWKKIWRCCNNKEGRTKHKGFVWKYADQLDKT